MAVLYLHGWNDYFFQTHLADAPRPTWASTSTPSTCAVTAAACGVGHLRGFITDLDEYDEELDAAADLIAADHDELLLMGHSTGGLIATLWAAAASATGSPGWCSTRPGWTCRARRWSAPSARR